MTDRTIERRHDSKAVERLLRSLPEWFGIERAIRSYVTDARVLPSYLALESGHVRGALLVKRHFDHAAEIYLMAVDPAAHRQGIGRALLAAAESDLRADGVRYLQVKTLGPSLSNSAYERTRRFYLACGFEPLEEIPDLWPGNPCLLLVKMLAERRT